MTLPPPPSSSVMPLLDNAKGRCTPSLLPNEAEISIDAAFLTSVSNLVDCSSVHGPILKNDTAVGKQFLKALEIDENLDAVISITVSLDDSIRKKILTYRRAILLLLIGCTPSNNVALNYIIQNGFLFKVKTWLDDILNNKIGGVDLLLHLLSSITNLPVSKEMVTSSKLGKNVAAIEKHKICVGGMNEKSIKNRVSEVKEAWKASVKRLKNKNKRSVEDGNVDTQNPAKRAKSAGTVAPTKSSLSKLIQQVSEAKNNESVVTSTTKSRTGDSTLGKKDTTQIKEELTTVKDTGDTRKISKKNQNRHIRWADHEGVPLTISYADLSEQVKENAKKSETKESWKDRKKRDRIKEKLLLQKAKKIKLVDEDDNLDTMAMIFSSKWHQPPLLPVENPPVSVTSQEMTVQTKRMNDVMPLHFLSEDDVPSNPYPLTESEETMDLNAQMATVPQIIPFFFSPNTITNPKLQAPTPAPAHLPVPPPPPISSNFAHTTPATLPPVGPAPIEVVRAMGLPDFLVGQNTQALQALVASSGLIDTFRDVNGNYDQMRIMSLIHAMNLQLQKNHIGAAQPPPPPPPVVHQPHMSQTLGSVPLPVQPIMGPYGPVLQPTQTAQASTHNTQKKSVSSAYRGDQNNTDGNLHLSGYGPNVPIDSIVALFAPYVKVDEVVPMSGGYMFLNTSDPKGAKRAKEALNGVMIGGTPLKINAAMRKNKNPSYASSTQGSSQSLSLLPRNALGQIDYDAVRDDRGNPATKNLFVAGYGNGTTEQQLRDVFNQYTTVTAVVIKGSFAFVNTCDKASAVIARQQLIGTLLSGSPLRINFAKESGRLGTSFDSSNSSSTAKKLNAIPNYYGHSYQ